MRKWTKFAARLRRLRRNTAQKRDDPPDHPFLRNYLLKRQAP